MRGQRTPQERHNLFNKLRKIFTAIWLCLLLLNSAFFIVLYGLGVISSTWILLVIVAFSVIIIVAAALVPATGILLQVLLSTYLLQMLLYAISDESTVWLSAVIVVLVVVIFASYCLTVLFIQKLQKSNKVEASPEDISDDVSDIFDDYEQ